MLSSNVAIIALAYLVGISLILVFNEISYRWFGLKSEYARKMAHVVATLATLPFPYLFSSHWYVLALAMLFFGVLWLTQRSKHLNSIHGIARRSYGSYLLPVSIYLTFLIYSFSNDPVMYVLPISILALCDPIAALTGMSITKYNRKLTLPGQHSKKTIAGSAAFFISSGLISAGILYGYHVSDFSTILRISTVVALVSTFAELFSWRGSDNLTIPVSVQLTLLWLI